MIAAIAIGAMLCGCSLVEAPAIYSEDGRVRVHDLITGDCEALSRSSDLVVAALPPGVHRRALTRAAWASLTQRRLPSLTIAGADRPDDIITLQSVQLRGAPAVQHCYVLSRAIGAREALEGRDLEPSSCGQTTTPIALTYDDGDRIVRAAIDAPQGAYVGALTPQPYRVIETQTPLQLRVTVGPVEVARNVRTVQASTVGQDVFVQTDDGQVFASPSDALHERAQ